MDGVKTPLTKQQRTISVDEQSLALADHFLKNEIHTEGDRWDLAKAIQEAVEDWFNDLH